MQDGREEGKAKDKDKIRAMIRKGKQKEEDAANGGGGGMGAGGATQKELEEEEQKSVVANRYIRFRLPLEVFPVGLRDLRRRVRSIRGLSAARLEPSVPGRPAG